MTPQTIVGALISKGNEIITHAKQAYIFRSSVAYIAQQIHSFLVALKPIVANQRTDAQIQALRQLQELFVHFDTVLAHLSEDKWIQPALNWPATYVHKYIDGFRESLIQIAPALGLISSDVIKFGEAQDQVNKRADLKGLKTSISSLMAQINTTDAVGVQQQIETKLSEISRLLPHEGKERRGSAKRRPSADNMPIIQMKKRVEELLVQFKSINIENDDLKLEGQIGAGGFGTVYKATRLSTAEIVAVKELRSDRLTMSSWASLYAEVETMASVRHPFVLELVGAHITEPYRIITRFCPGKSLFDRLHRSNKGLPMLNTSRLTVIAYQVAVGMAHLHSMSIVHRDLKTLNILLDDHEDGCVADFGLSGMMKDNQELCGGVGTPHYTAPEVLSHTRYGPKVDTFSYGVVLWEMLMRKVPYGEMSHMAIYEHVVTRGWRLPIPNETPEGLKKLITRCWSKSPNDRPEFNEIIELFEKKEVSFPNSEPIDFEAIKATRRCPPLNLEFALTALKNSNDEHFSSIIYYICSKIDDQLKDKLRSEHLVDNLVNAQCNIDAVLVLASALLSPEEFTGFLEKGGLELFKICVETNRGQLMSAALRFGLKAPKAELAQLKTFLPQIVQFLEFNQGASNSHTLQFLTRFNGDELAPFTQQISTALLEAAMKVEDQQTFDAIVALLPLCKETLSPDQLRVFYRLLSCDFVVPSAFVSALIEANDSWSHASLILSILKATAKSDITDVFLSFLQKVAHIEKEVFEQLYKMQDFFSTMQELLESENVRAPLFLLFCIAPIKEAAMKLAHHPMLTSLITMKGHQVQRLQIFTILCMQEEFCLETTYIDGIIHLLVASLSVKSYVGPAVKLIGAFSTHAGGCQILSDNGVLELFTQLFLSSSSGDTVTSHTILRNVAKNDCEIPQGSLIVSCLMQDMIYDMNRRCEILDTLVALVETMPGSVQEHDLQRIVMQQLSQDKPLLVLLSLRLFSVCEPNSLRNIYPQLLGAIYNLLDNPKFLYPEIIEASLDVISLISHQYDITEFVKKTQLRRFIIDVVSLLPENDPSIVRITNFSNSLIERNS